MNPMRTSFQADYDASDRESCCDRYTVEKMERERRVQKYAAMIRCDKEIKYLAIPKGE